METQAYALLLLAGIVIVLVTPLCRQFIRRRFDPFSPLAVVSATYLGYFAFAPSVDLLTRNTSFMGVDLTHLLPRALGYALAGFVAMLVGYYARLGRLVAARLPKPILGAVNTFRWGLVVYLAGFLGWSILLDKTGRSWVTMLSLGQLGERLEGEWTPSSAPLYYYLYMSMNLMIPGTVMMWASSRAPRWMLPIVAAVPLLTYTTVGFRYRVIVLVVALVALRYFRRQARPRLGSLLAILAMGFVIVGGIGAVRNDIRAGNTFELPSLQDAWREFRSSIALYQPFAVVIDRLSHSGKFYWGSSYFYVLLQPIPRALWREKPDAPVHGILRDVLGDEAVRMGVAYPQIGEFYVNFGLPGIIIGMSMFGMLLRVLAEFYCRYAGERSVQAFAAVAVAYLIEVVSRGYFVQITTEAAFTLLPLIILMWMPGPITRGRLVTRDSHQVRGLP